MPIPLSFLYGPLAKKAGLPTAADLWANRSRGPVGSPAWQKQQDAGAHPGFGEDLSFKTNTPFGIQNPDPGYWQLPYRDVRKRSKQDWAAPDPSFLFTNPITGETAPVPVEIQPQEPGRVAKAIGAPGVPSSSGLDPRGDSSIYAGQGSRELAKFAAAQNPDKQSRTFGSEDLETGQRTSSWYTPGEGVSSTNLVAAENVSPRGTPAPLADDTSLNEGQDSGNEGKGGK